MSRVVIAILVVIVHLAPAIAAPDAKQLAKDKVALAEKVYKGTLDGMKIGRAATEAAYVWSVRWLDAEVASGKTAKQAMSDHLARMTLLEAELGKAKASGQATALDHDASTYYKLEAELWVVRGKR